MASSISCPACSADAPPGAVYSRGCGRPLLPASPLAAPSRRRSFSHAEGWKLSRRRSKQQVTPPAASPPQAAARSPRPSTAEAAGEGLSQPTPGGRIIEDEVRWIQTRSKHRGQNWQRHIGAVWPQQQDQVGNRALVVPVGMLSHTFEVSASDGDWLCARGSIKRGTFRVTEFENRTTGARPRSKCVPRIIATFAAILYFLVLLTWPGEHCRFRRDL